MNAFLKISLLSVAVSASAMSFAQNHISYGSQQSIDFKYLKGERRTGQIAYRAFEGMSYVVNPIDRKYQTINIYIPDAYYSGGAVNGFKSATAPVLFYVVADDYREKEAAKADGNKFLQQALSHGYIVACPGVRGRTLQSGKAPAVVADLKAAVRYLKYNDDDMPGDATKIVACGAGAGGAMAAMLGASGLSSDYDAMLDELGATRSDDDVFGVVALSPSTIPNHADEAAAWQTGNDAKGDFSKYINSLNLKGTDGSQLTLDASGQGSFLAALEREAKTAAKGHTENFSLMNHSKTTVLGKKYDAPDRSSSLNDLFGTGNGGMHFTMPYADDANMVSPMTVRMMTPMTYIGNSDIEVAPHWLVRQSLADSYPSVLSFVLAVKLRNAGKTVAYSMAWDGQTLDDSESYGVFKWIDGISR